MGRLLKSLFFRMFLFSVLSVSVLLVCFYYLQYIPSHEKLLRNALYDRVKTVFDLSADDLSKAVRSRDDISMLIGVEKIMKIEDVSTVYVLDNGFKVLTHDKTSQWGKTYDDETDRNAVNAKKVLRQWTQGGYLFSVPLTSSSTLCVGISSQKMNEAAAGLRRDALYTIAIVVIAAAAAFGWFIYATVFLRFRDLRDRLASIELGGGTLPDGAPGGEFLELQKLINGIIANAASGAGRGRAGQCEDELRLLVDELAATHQSGVLVIGAENKVVAINRKGETLFGIKRDGAAGKHVLEAVGDAALIELIKKAAAKPGEAFEASVSGKPVKAYSIRGPDKAVPGTLVISL